jgi:uncharacterized protein YxeA
MELIFFIILIIVILIILKLIIDYNSNVDTFENYKISIDDSNYYNKFYKSEKMNNLINNNKLNIPKEKKNKILFITYDNRYNEDYVSIHNANINKYVKKFNYEYKYYKYCDKNVYWCKIYLVLEALKTNKYDYVIWLDSDTVIKNFKIDFGDILNIFSSDIFIGLDNNLEYGLINSGVFAISNSEIGKNFLLECIQYVNKDCFNDNGTLKGKWAASCYEQGVMNILIHDKYYLYTTVLSNKVIFNYNVCSNDVFIMHLYASPSKSRISCFQ